MFVIKTTKDMREFLDLMMSQASKLRQASTTQKDKKFYDGKMAGLQEAINMLDYLDKCSPENEVLDVLEEMIVAAFDEPVDTPRLDHPYWGDVLRKVAKNRRETPEETMARIIRMHKESQ